MLTVCIRGLEAPTAWAELLECETMPDLFGDGVVLLRHRVCIPQRATTPSSLWSSRARPRTKLLGGFLLVAAPLLSGH